MKKYIQKPPIIPLRPTAAT